MKQEQSTVMTPKPFVAPGGGIRRARLLLGALAPFLLLVVLTAGIRLADHLSAADEGAATDELLRRIAGEPRRPGRPGGPPPSPAPPADAKTQAAIESTVRGQLGAFGRGDFRAALAFAMPEMRDSWNPDDFRRIVEGGYPVMCEVKASTLERARVREGRQAELQVVITGRSGARAGYLYHLVKAGERWCVAGVAPLGPERPGSADRPGGKGEDRGGPPAQRPQRPRPVGRVLDIREV